MSCIFIKKLRMWASRRQILICVHYIFGWLEYAGNYLGTENIQRRFRHCQILSECGLMAAKIYEKYSKLKCAIRTKEALSLLKFGNFAFVIFEENFKI